MQFSGLNIDIFTQTILIILCVSGLVWLVSIWLSYRKSKQFILLKSLLLLLSILSVNALLLQPKYKKLKPVSTAVLFTQQLDVKNFDPDQWLDKNYSFFKLPKLKANQTDTAILKSVVNVEHLITQYQPLDSVLIVGNQIPAIDMKTLPDVPIRFVNSLTVKPLNALLSFQYSNKLNVNDQFNASIKLDLDSTFHKYLIQSPFSQTDTISFKENPLLIEHKAICAIAGNHLVKLHFLNEHNSTVEEIILPVEVTSKQKANILMLNGHPNFEHKHLKNWIAKQGHQLKVRTQVSLKNYQYDWINDKKKNAFNINDALLKTIDLLIMDGAAFFALTENEYTSIKRRHQKGMNILLRTDEAILKAENKWAEFQINIEQIAESKRMFANILLNNQVIEVEIYPYQNNLFSSKRFKGKDAGKIISTNRSLNRLLGITNLQNTYLLNLKGDTSIYNKLWLGIMDEMTGTKNISANTWQTKEPFPQVGHSIEIILRSNEEAPKAFFRTPKTPITPKTPKSDWSVLNLKQHHLIAEQYDATFWAHKAGWYQFKTEKDSTTAPIYIAGKPQNNLIKTFNNNLWNAKYIQQIQKKDTSTYHPKKVYTKMLISPIWNWLIFIISLSTIWIIEKLIEN